jgi:hypothetical protein
MRTALRLRLQGPLVIWVGILSARGTLRPEIQDLYDRALIGIEPDDTPTGTPTDGQQRPPRHSALLTRHHRYTRKISYFRAWTPHHHRATPTTSTTGHDGDAATKPSPEPATEPGTPTQTKSHDHHELQLPCHSTAVCIPAPTHSVT